MRRIIVLGLWFLIFQFAVIGCSTPKYVVSVDEIAFTSGSFKVVGDLSFPESKGPHPVILFVHGDGPNDRTSGGTYLPIMERMLRAGYATFAWDKPGTGESIGQIDRSRLVDQRAQIVLDAIATVKEHPDIDVEHIGLWGVSQAGYVMPTVLSRSNEVAFMIAVSCPGAPGVDQGAYLVASQAVCAGLPKEDVDEVKSLISAIERARTYDEYVYFKEQLADYSMLQALTELGLTMRIKAEDEWHADDLEGPYFWNPMEIIEQTTMPVLAFFGSKDTQVDPVQGVQAYTEALNKAGNSNFQVELIPDTNHLIVLAETGCIEEIKKMSRKERLNYAPEYLDILEAWLRSIHP
jgi:pimeloyl-ACP methyl ester carboxylesterase